MPYASDFVRTQEDPVTFFRLRALALAPRLGLPIGDVDRLVTTVIAALGVDWLNFAAVDVPPSTPLPFPRHHLGQIIATAGEEQVAELLELGEYLEALYTRAGVPQAIVGLKAGYYQTLLQLAFATRFQTVDAIVAALEPPAAQGRLSDIRLLIEGQPYRVECYRPTYKGKNEHAYELLRIAQDVLKKAGQHPHIYSVAIELTEHPAPARRRELVAAVGRAMHAVDSDAAVPGGSVPVLTTGPFATISVGPAFPTRPGTRPVLPRHPDFPRKGNDFHSFMRAGVISTAEAAGIYGQPDMGTGTSCVGIWAPGDPSRPADENADPAKHLERLGRKIEKKIVQTRSQAGDARVIIADAWEVDHLATAGPQAIDRLRGKLIRAHVGVAAILLTHRRWAPKKGRHAYPLTAIIRDDASPAIVDRIARLGAIDAA